LEPYVGMRSRNRPRHISHVMKPDSLTPPTSATALLCPVEESWPRDRHLNGRVDALLSRATMFGASRFACDSANCAVGGIPFCRLRWVPQHSPCGPHPFEPRNRHVGIHDLERRSPRDCRRVTSQDGRALAARRPCGRLSLPIRLDEEIEHCARKQNPLYRCGTASFPIAPYAPVALCRRWLGGCSTPHGWVVRRALREPT
jgi:hypothetical protein